MYLCWLLSYIYRKIKTMNSNEAKTLSDNYLKLSKNFAEISKSLAQIEKITKGHNLPGTARKKTTRKKAHAVVYRDNDNTGQLLLTELQAMNENTRKALE